MQREAVPGLHKMAGKGARMQCYSCLKRLAHDHKGCITPAYPSLIEVQTQEEDY